MRSNCIAVALQVFWMALRSKEPKGQETYLLLRRSRSKWGFVHMLWGKRNPLTGTVEVHSFKPLRPVDVPWYRALTRLRFTGEVRRGDSHHTLPR